MKICIVIVCLLHLSECSQVSPNPIYEIIAKSDSKQCYTCEENCSDPVLKDCHGASKCFSKSIKRRGTAIDTKGCVELNSINTLCGNKSEEITSCYTCDSDFCNSNSGNIRTDNGVSKCYVCIDECEQPPDQHNCEVLTEIEGHVVKASCLTFQITKEEETTISKGCVTNDESVRSACFLANFAYPEVTCSMCDTDLCNSDVHSVEECYYCKDVCKEPLETQKCEILGDVTSKCIVMELVTENESVVSRGCIEVTESVQSECDRINEQGGNCTICDTSLCNGVVHEDTSVEECYYCKDVCKEPLEKQKCEVLGDVTSKCIVMELVTDEQSVLSRGCIEVTDSVQSECDRINHQGGNCTICDTSLCNGIHKNGGSSSERVHSLVHIILLLVICLLKFN